jgi:hypothetical protein
MQAATKKNVKSISCFEGENGSKHPKSPPAVGKEKNVHRLGSELTGKDGGMEGKRRGPA